MYTSIAEAVPTNVEPITSFPMIWFWFVPVVIIPGVWFLAVKLSRGKKKQDD
jgi:hypothetical protein